MEIRQLRYFVAVAEEEHVARAARRLHVSASPLSRQIQQLEDEVHVPLFTRTGRRLRLTDAGRVFLDEARQVLSRLDLAVTRAQAANRGAVGKLRVAFIEADRFPLMLPGMISRVRTEHPELHLDLVPMGGQEQLRALDAREIDAGLMFKPERTPGHIEVETLFTERLHIVVATGHPLARRARINARDLVRLPIIAPARTAAPGYFDRLRVALREHGVDMNVVLECWSVTTRMCLVASGIGAAFTVPSAIGPFRGVVALPLGDVRVDVEGALVWHRDNAASVALKWFRKITLSVSRKMH